MKFRSYHLFLFICCFRVQISEAQGIERAKFLMFLFSTNKEFPAVYSDSIIITRTSNDTIWFNTTVSNPSGQGFYYRAGQKVYRKSGTKDVLLYDYSLQKGDSFFIHINPAPYGDTFIVDSVYYRKFGQRSFKAWHLSAPRPRMLRGNWDWIEGMGELRQGWDTRNFIFVDGGWIVKGTCLNDSLFFWDSSYNYLKDRNPSPSCLFDSISRQLEVRKHINPDLICYPNPTSDKLTIFLESEAVLNITDQAGRIVISEKPLENGLQSLDVSVLQPGIYFLTVRTQNGVFFKKICIIRP